MDVEAEKVFNKLKEREPIASRQEEVNIS